MIFGKLCCGNGGLVLVSILDVGCLVCVSEICFCGLVFVICGWLLRGVDLLELSELIVIVL